MTVIAAVRQDNLLTIGWDSRTTYETDHTTMEGKVFMRGDVLFGVTGDWAVLNILATQTWSGCLSPPAMAMRLRKVWKDNQVSSSHEPDLDAHLLVCFGKFVCTGTMSGDLAEIPDSFFAIGSGGPLAEGALYATQKWSSPVRRVQCALEAAAWRNTECGPPFRMTQWPIE